MLLGDIVKKPVKLALKESKEIDFKEIKKEIKNFTAFQTMQYAKNQVKKEEKKVTKLKQKQKIEQEKLKKYKKKKEDEKKQKKLLELQIQEERLKQFPHLKERIHSPLGFDRRITADGKVRYTEEEKLHILACLDLDKNAVKTARENNIPYASVYEFRGRSKVGEKVGHIRDLLDDHTLHTMKEGIDKHLDHLIQPETISKSTAAKSATVVGILTDKLLRILGHPDQLIKSYSLNISKSQEVKVVLDEIRSNPGQFRELFTAYREDQGKLIPPEIKQLTEGGSK